MKKIESLTAEQIALFPEYRDRWLQIGLSTKEADHEKARDAVIRVYQAANLKPPSVFIWLKSPLAGAMGAHMLSQTRAQVGAQVWAQVGAQVWAQIGAQVRDQVWDQVGDQVWAQVGNQVRDQVWDQVGAQVGNQVWDQIGAQVGDQVGAQVGNQVWAQIGDQVRDQVGDQVGDQVWRAGYGSHDASWLAFYNYFLKVTDLKCCERLIPLMDLSEVCGWWWPFEGAVILTEKPTQIHLLKKRLHQEGGPAILYPDGFAIYALNGVRVSQEIAETPAHLLSADLITKEKNAQVRAEIVKKIGVERVIRDLGAECIDTWKDYELLLLDLKDGRKRPYLKMKNPSVSLIHIEGVPPEIKKVKEALAWRMGLKKFVQPDILT